MSDQQTAQTKLELAPNETGKTNVEMYEFEPIKGYPMLNWRGKRPFTSTQYFPAQLKEIHGTEVDGWRNKIFWGDNLQVMSHLLKGFRRKVDAVYMDPPFDSRVDYSRKISLKSASSKTSPTNFEEKQYSDIWSNDEYLQFMFDRLILLRELMAEHAVILVHADWHKVHHLRCILDEVFGANNFLNEIVWKYDGPGAPSKLRFGSKHDTILRYCKNESALSSRIQQMELDGVAGAYMMYGDVVVPDAEANFERDDSGRYFFTLPRGDYSDDSIERLRSEGRIKESSSGNVRIKYFVKKIEGGFLKREKLQDVWFDIASLGLAANSIENTRYPTQKPEKLIDRLIASTTAPTDLVFDCFMGAGTTQAVALKLGRRFLGADINLGAIQTTIKRLVKLVEEPRPTPSEIKAQIYTGFEVYNVNHYDIFRNPVQAKNC
jgi:adenine-specific DNA-methyltransferase